MSTLRAPLAMLAICLLLIPFGVLTLDWASGGEFGDTFGMLRGVFGIFYAGIGGIKAINIWRQQRNRAGVGKPSNAAVVFAMIAAALLLPVPALFWVTRVFFPPETPKLDLDLEHIPEAHVYKPGEFPPPVPEDLWMTAAGWALWLSFLTILCSPWIVLLILKRFRHLRTQAVWGLCATPFVPMLALLANILVTYRLYAPFAIAALFVLAMMWLREKWPEKLALRLGQAALLTIIGSISGYIWLMSPLYRSWPMQDRGDYAGAIAQLRPLAESGGQNAQWSLGHLYSASNPAEAIKWYKLAGEQGHGFALLDLAEMYRDGTGVKKDPLEAAKWFQKSAEHGNASAQFDVAELYEQGKDGLPKDAAQAAAWYLRAARQGVSCANRRLYDMYKKGVGVPQDYVEAYFWLHASDAWDRKYGFFPFHEHEDPDTRAHLSPDQLSAVKARLEDWRTRPENWRAEFVLWP
jgi:hypothetical protein